MICIIVTPLRQCIDEQQSARMAVFLVLTANAAAARWTAPQLQLHSASRHHLIHDAIQRKHCSHTCTSNSAQSEQQKRSALDPLPLLACLLLGGLLALNRPWIASQQTLHFERPVACGLQPHEGAREAKLHRLRLRALPCIPACRCRGCNSVDSARMFK